MKVFAGTKPFPENEITARTTVNNSAEQVTIQLESAVAENTVVRVEIVYSGLINRYPVGLYKAEYMDGGESKYVINRIIPMVRHIISYMQ